MKSRFRRSLGGPALACLLFAGWPRAARADDSPAEPQAEAPAEPPADSEAGKPDDADTRAVLQRFLDAEQQRVGDLEQQVSQLQSAVEELQEKKSDRDDTDTDPPVGSAHKHEQPVDSFCALFDRRDCGPRGPRIGFESRVASIGGLTFAASVPPIGVAPRSAETPALVDFGLSMRLDGAWFGGAMSPLFLDGLVAPGKIGMLIPLEIELHRRFGWIEPSLGAEGLVAYIGYTEPVTAAPSTALALEGRLGLRVFLTPTVNLSGFAGRSLAGSAPLSEAGLTLGWAWTTGDSDAKEGR